jgi:hypothetical protein
VSNIVTDILYHDCRQLKNVVISLEIKGGLAESNLVYDRNQISLHSRFRWLHYGIVTFLGSLNKNYGQLIQ